MDQRRGVESVVADTGRCIGTIFGILSTDLCVRRVQSTLELSSVACLDERTIVADRHPS